MLLSSFQFGCLCQYRMHKWLSLWSQQSNNAQHYQCSFRIYFFTFLLFDVCVVRACGLLHCVRLGWFFYFLCSHSFGFDFTFGAILCSFISTVNTVFDGNWRTSNMIICLPTAQHYRIIYVIYNTIYNTTLKIFSWNSKS